MNREVFLKLQHRRDVLENIFKHIDDPAITAILSEMKEEIEQAITPPGGWVAAYTNLVRMLKNDPDRPAEPMDMLTAFEASMDYIERLYLANDYLMSKVDNETATQAMAILMNHTLEEQKQQEEKMREMISALLNKQKSA